MGCALLVAVITHLVALVLIGVAVGALGWGTRALFAAIAQGTR